MLRRLLMTATILWSFSGSAEPLNLTDDNTVFLKDVVYPQSITSVMAELSKRESNSEPVIYLVLDTPGGSVFSGLNLIHYLKGYKKPIKTITIFSASMGFQIAQGNPGERLIVDTGILMSHPMSGVQGGEYGKNMSLENRYNSMLEIVKTMDINVVSRTNGKQSLESYVKAYDNELWVTGSTAVEQGYADEVTSISCSEALTSSNILENSREYLGDGLAIEIKYEYSKCPLMISVLKYRVTVVRLADNKKFIITNNGYPIEEENKESKNIFEDLFGDANISRKKLDNIVASSEKYKTLMFLLDRKSVNIKDINKFN